MNRQEILNTLISIFAETLDEDIIQLTEQTTAEDVEGWDSLSHVQIVVAVERKFKLRFTSREIQSWKNIGELIDSIISKLT